MLRKEGKKQKKPDDRYYSCLIYNSDENKCWTAHSLHADQIGTGDCIMDALVDMIKAVNQVYDLAQSEKGVRFECEAPSMIQRRASRAAHLPKEIYEIAHKKVNKEWPSYIESEFKLDACVKSLIRRHC